MMKTFILTVSCCLLGATILTALLPDEKIKPFAKLGISFVIISVFLSSIFGLKTVDIEVPEAPVANNVDVMKEVYQDQIERTIKTKYDVSSTAIVEIDENKEIALKKIILYDGKYMLEIKEEFKPEELEIK